MGMVEKNLGQRVAELRKLAGITQAGLAERIGVATETISRLERGAALPGLVRVEDIAGVLGVELAELFRFKKRLNPKEVAVERLVSVARHAEASDIEFLADIAARIFEHLKSKRSS